MNCPIRTCINSLNTKRHKLNKTCGRLCTYYYCINKEHHIRSDECNKSCGILDCALRGQNTSHLWTNECSKECELDHCINQTINGSHILKATCVELCYYNECPNEYGQYIRHLLKDNCKELLKE